MPKRRRRRASGLGPHPSPGAFDREIREAVVMLLRIRQRYHRDYEEGLLAPGTSGSTVGVGQQGNATEAAWASRLQRRYRSAARHVVRLVREATGALEEALEVGFHVEQEQPRKVHPQAIITQADLDASLQRRGETG